MNSVQAQATRGIARALGPFLIIFGAAVAMRAAEMPLMLPAFFQDATLVFVAAAFTLALGLGILAAHHHFNSPPAFIISVFAIVTAIRGAVLLLAPSVFSALATNILRVPTVALVPAIFAVLIGAYLGFAGWFAKSA